MFGGFFKSSSYGKSAYLLVYEKRYKSSIKVLVPSDHDTTSQKYENVQIHTDPQTNEKYVLKPIAEANKLFVPKNIYNEIWEDNLEFTFEKLIYSKEFYEFVKELMLATLRLTDKDRKLNPDDCDSVGTIISNMTSVGNKLVLEVLAKAFYNYKMSEVADILIKLYEASDEAVISTMKYILANENIDQLLYVFEVLLGCPDKISRSNTAKIVTTLVNRCFEIEKQIMHESETIKIPIEGEVVAQADGSQEQKYGEITRPKSMALRFWDLTMIALKEKAPS